MVIVDVLDKKLRSYEPLIRESAEWLLRKYKKTRFVLEISLVGNEILEKNVLSFAANGIPRPDLKGKKSLGEIYLNPYVIAKQGEDLRYMLIHGFLHVLGYDHLTPRDTITMEKLEQKLLGELTTRS